MAQVVKTLRVVEGREPSATQARESVVLVDEDGNPVNLGGGTSGPSQSDFDALAARVDALESAGD